MERSMNCLLWSGEKGGASPISRWSDCETQPWSWLLKSEYFCSVNIYWAPTLLRNMTSVCFYQTDSWTTQHRYKQSDLSQIWNYHYFSSVQFSRSVVSDSLRPHESQHARLPCPSPTPRVYSNSSPSSRWCHPTISSSVVPFSSCPQSLPASGSFPMNQLFASLTTTQTYRNKNRCCTRFAVQSVSHVQLFATPWTVAHQASLSFIISWSLLKFMSTESVMPSNHLFLSPPSPPALNLSKHLGQNVKKIKKSCFYTRQYKSLLLVLPFSFVFQVITLSQFSSCLAIYSFSLFAGSSFLVSTSKC